MISIQQMHYILVLSEQQQFQRASELCFVTQPTLSMQIKKAEETLGYLIFDRSRNPLELTNFGHHLVPLIREVLNENGKIETLIKKMSGNYNEQIKVAIIPTIASYLVPHLFTLWKSKIKGIQLIIEEQKTDEALDSLEKKTVDFAIIAGPYHDSSLRTIPLYKEEILAYTQDTEEDTIDSLELQQLHPWLLSMGNCLRSQMIQFCKIKEVSDSNEWNYEGGNIEILLKMVDDNGGYSFVPAHYCLSESRRKQLKHIVSATNVNHFPAREVVALVPHRSTKWVGIEALIREAQFYYQSSNESFDVLDWNAPRKTKKG